MARLSHYCQLSILLLPVLAFNLHLETTTEESFNDANINLGLTTASNQEGSNDGTDYPTDDDPIYDDNDADPNDKYSNIAVGFKVLEYVHPKKIKMALRRNMVRKALYRYMLVGNWCGPSNVSKNNFVLTEEPSLRELDSCCRDHDYCPLSIAHNTFNEMLGFGNPGSFTISLCECDVTFLNCLKDIHGNTVSAIVGRAYFTFMRKCLNYDYQIVKCKRKLGTRCTEYEKDLSNPKRWQLFHLPYYETNATSSYAILNKKEREIFLFKPADDFTSQLQSTNRIVAIPRRLFSLLGDVVWTKMSSVKKALSWG